MKKGFTLVELSIVLVIIGLLIGGILVAQSMIGTAKVQAFVRQIGQFDAAVENFVTKFNQLPGDTNLMGLTSVGNNNGRIEGGAGSTQGEAGKFWADLQKSGLSKEGGGEYVDDYAGQNSGLAPQEYFPKSLVGQDAYVVPNGYGGVGGDPWMVAGNYYLVGGVTPSNGQAGLIAIKPADVLAVDTKLDDGKANSGNMGVHSSWTDCILNGNYLVSDTGNVCYMMIRMGASTGNLH